MEAPALVFYENQEEYREHYLNGYCRSVIRTFDGIRVYFSPDRFGHAFRESSARDGNKDTFSQVRAQRIDWIRATLESPDSDLFQGWDSRTKSHDPRSRVSVVLGDFVVIVRLGRTRRGDLKGTFVTCYEADNSINKIRSSPRWTLENFEAVE